jgi:membrane-associated phospholipid phosphatase
MTALKSDHDQTTPSLRILYLGSVVLWAAAAAAMPFDLVISQFCFDDRLPDPIPKILDLAETFGHGWGVLLILVATMVIGRFRLREMTRVVFCAFGAGLAADVVKLCVGRVRPYPFQFQGDVLDTFLGLFPFAHAENIRDAFESDFQSMPSGHTATAVGLAVGLSTICPHARWFFAGMAALVAMQRVESMSHYVSDTLAGAALACLWCALCLDRRYLGKWIAELERNPAEGETP